LDITNFLSIFFQSLSSEEWRNSHSPR